MGFFDYFRKKSLIDVSNQGGWSPIMGVHEPYTGAWQYGNELKRTDLTNFHAIFACVSLIASDIVWGTDYSCIMKLVKVD